MRSLLALAVVLSLVGCAAKPPQAPAAIVTPMKLPSDASAIELTLTTGSCWGVSTESRSVALGSSEIVIAASGLDGETRQTRAWWEKTRALLDDGLANATGETARSNPALSSCFGPPNSVCSFDLRIATPRGEEHLHGCCTQRGAHHVEMAFRRLKPGSSLAAD